MTRLTTEHRGFAIHYGENSDDWNCHALELAAPTLSALKRKIDAVERTTRKTESIPAFVIGHRGEIEAVIITAKVGKSSGPVRRYWDEKEGVWCVSTDGKEKRRKKVELKYCVEGTSENRAMIDEYRQLCGVIKAAEKAAKDYLATLPRMAMDAIAPADPEID